jgi:SAM-dependent methyltransferase
MTQPEPSWLAANRANWNERVPIHLAAPFYDFDSLRRGEGKLYAIEEAELGSVAGLRILHLQCHIGTDTLVFPQRGAPEVVGVDFSEPAIQAARALAGELGLTDRSRFVLSDIYTAPETLLEPASFDLVYSTWGTISWLPDIVAWAGVVGHFLKPGGRLYLADSHPGALVFDDGRPGVDGMPGWLVPYFQDEPYVDESGRDYADTSVKLSSNRTFDWLHPLSSILSALMRAGLRIEFFHEHDAIVWPMFKSLVRGEDGLYRWPRQRWLPLAFSISAIRE